MNEFGEHAVIDSDETNSIESLSTENSNVKESLEIFMVLDQLHIKINELNAEMEQLIQDLVMANAGHVTYTFFLNITTSKHNSTSKI